MLGYTSGQLNERELGSRRVVLDMCSYTFSHAPAGNGNGMVLWLMLIVDCLFCCWCWYCWEWCWICAAIRFLTLPQLTEKERCWALSSCWCWLLIVCFAVALLLLWCWICAVIRFHSPTQVKGGLLLFLCFLAVAVVIDFLLFFFFFCCPVYSLR